MILRSAGDNQDTAATTQIELREDDSLAEIHSLRHALRSVGQEVRRSVVGHDTALQQMVLCLAAGGDVLLEGPPGTGKSLALRSFAAAAGLACRHLRVTPDLTSDDLLAGLNANAGAAAAATEPQGELLPPVLMLVDEIDQATPRVQSCLAQIMEERTITVSGRTWPLPLLFAVAATRSRPPMETGHPLSERSLDHFLMKLELSTPSAAELVRILGRTTGPDSAPAGRVADPDALVRVARLVRQVPIARHVTDYAVRLVLATHPHNEDAALAVHRHVASGASPRGAQALVLAAKAAAFADGRYNVSFDDLRLVALPALRHRLILTPEARGAGVDVDAVIEELLAAVPEEP